MRISAYGSWLAAARSSARSKPRRLHTPVSGSSSAIARWCDSARTRRPFRNWTATRRAGHRQGEHREPRGVAKLDGPVVVEERRRVRVDEQRHQRPGQARREEVRDEQRGEDHHRLDEAGGAARGPERERDDRHRGGRDERAQADRHAASAGREEEREEAPGDGEGRKAEREAPRDCGPSPAATAPRRRAGRWPST